jgi:hypothetical protein
MLRALAPYSLGSQLSRGIIHHDNRQDAHEPHAAFGSCAMLQRVSCLFELKHYHYMSKLRFNAWNTWIFSIVEFVCEESLGNPFFSWHLSSRWIVGSFNTLLVLYPDSLNIQWSTMHLFYMYSSEIYVVEAPNLLFWVRLCTMSKSHMKPHAAHAAFAHPV